MHASETMLIGGEWVEAAAGRTLEVRNPATDEVIARVPDAGAEDMDRAVRAARSAFDGGWRDTTAQARGRQEPATTDPRQGHPFQHRITIVLGHASSSWPTVGLRRFQTRSSFSSRCMPNRNRGWPA